MSRHQNAGQNHNLKISKRSFENVAQFRYLGTTATNQCLLHKEIKRRLNSGNACYHSVQNILSSRLLFKNVKIRTYKIIMLFVVLYMCETLSLTLGEEHRLRVFEKRVVVRIFVPKRDEVKGRWRKLYNEGLHNLYSSSSKLRMIKSRGDVMGRACRTHREKRNACSILMGKPEGKRPLRRSKRTCEDNIKNLS
jgi:hypothetical protein